MPKCFFFPATAIFFALFGAGTRLTRTRSLRPDTNAVRMLAGITALATLVLLPMRTKYKRLLAEQGTYEVHIQEQTQTTLTKQ